MEPTGGQSLPVVTVSDDDLRPVRPDRPATPAVRPFPRHSGLDLARVAALVLVLAQHWLTVSGREHLTHVGRLNIGQAGVALFLALSGWLAASDSRPPLRWLWRRLSRLYPAYWIAIAVSFAVAATTGYKSFDVAQFVSQMAGVGYFTHGDRLVNVASWFVSLLLLCYAATFLCRLTRREDVAAAVLIAALTAAAAFRIEPFLCCHALTYFVALVVRSKASGRTASVLLVAVSAGASALAYWSATASFGNTSFGLLALGASLPVRAVPAGVTVASGYAYEIYLIHGIFFVGAARRLHGPEVFKLATALVASSVAAVVLHFTAALLTRRTDGLFGCFFDRGRSGRGRRADGD